MVRHIYDTVSQVEPRPENGEPSIETLPDAYARFRAATKAIRAAYAPSMRRRGPKGEAAKAERDAVVAFIKSEFITEHVLPLAGRVPVTVISRAMSHGTNLERFYSFLGNRLGEYHYRVVTNREGGDH